MWILRRKRNQENDLTYNYIKKNWLPKNNLIKWNICTSKNNNTFYHTSLKEIVEDTIIGLYIMFMHWNN